MLPPKSPLVDEGLYPAALIYFGFKRQEGASELGYALRCARTDICCPEAVPTSQLLREDLWAFMESTRQSSYATTEEEARIAAEEKAAAEAREKKRDAKERKGPPKWFRLGKR